MIHAIKNSTLDQLDRLPPCNIDAEHATLASMMLDPDVRSEILLIVNRDSFYQPDHQIIFDAIFALHEKAVDVLLVKEELRRLKLLEEIGGVHYLGQILNTVPSASHGVHYAKIVRDKYLLRQLIGAANDVLREAYEPRQKADDVCDKAESAFLKITERRVTDRPVLIGDALMEAYEAYENKGTRGIDTGFFELDDTLNGLQDGELIIIGARPSLGKTALGLDILTHVATHTGPVLFFSMEMSQRMISQRLLCAHAGVDAQKMRRGFIGTDDYKALANSVDALHKLKIHISDAPTMNTLQMRAKARLEHRHNGIKLILLDYLQLMDSPVQESRQQQITEISRGIKALARELNVPIIALSQLNRQNEARTTHRPRLSDLRESGSIEQDADVVMLLHREDCYRQEDANSVPDNIAEVIVAKQRNGPTGTVKLTFDARCTAFRNLSHTAPSLRF